MYNKKLIISSAVISSTCFGLFSQSPLVCSAESNPFATGVQNFLKSLVTKNLVSLEDKDIVYAFLNFFTENNFTIDCFMKLIKCVRQNKEKLFEGYTIIKENSENYAIELDCDKIKEYVNKPEFSYYEEPLIGDHNHKKTEDRYDENSKRILHNVRNHFFKHLINNKIDVNSWSQIAKENYNLLCKLENILKPVEKYANWLRKIRNKGSNQMGFDYNEEKGYYAIFAPTPQIGVSYNKVQMLIPPKESGLDENSNGKWTLRYVTGKSKATTVDILLDDIIARWIIDTCEKKIQKTTTEEKNESLKKEDHSALSLYENVNNSEDSNDIKSDSKLLSNKIKRHETPEKNPFGDVTLVQKSNTVLQTDLINTNFSTQK